MPSCKKYMPENSLVSGRPQYHAEVLGCWFHDPRHAGQLGMERSRLRVSEDLYFEDGPVRDLQLPL